MMGPLFPQSSHTEFLMMGVLGVLVHHGPGMSPAGSNDLEERRVHQERQE